MPDIFVPLDTTSVTGFYSKIIRQGTLNSFVLDYIDNTRKKLKSNYDDFTTFNNQFKVSDKILIDLREYGLKNDIETTDDEFEKSKEDFKLIVKALIARDLWDMSEYFQIVNTRDKGFKKAVEIMQNWDDYKKQVLNSQ